jgi:hypothetical protein
MMVV